MNIIEAWNKAKVGQIITGGGSSFIRKSGSCSDDLYPAIRKLIDKGCLTLDCWRIEDPEQEIKQHRCVIEYQKESGGPFTRHVITLPEGATEFKVSME
jgi:hypothetical protein